MVRAPHGLRRSRRGWLLGTVVALAACSEGQSGPRTARPAPSTAVGGRGAAAFTLTVRPVADAPGWKSPRAEDWNGVPGTSLLLNRTPPAFATDTVSPTAPPAAEVRAVATGSALYIRLRWDDPTEERWPGPAAKAYANERIYKKPTTRPAGFYDGAAVMVPRGGLWRSRFPSPVMGDAEAPVTIYFWRHGDHPQVLSGLGRGTVTPAQGQTLEATVVREARAWAAVFVLPAPADPQTPLAFAIWDGGQAQRNGDKFFSPWYRPAVAASASR
jgi:DMSO reductase family type II enzyme heme b subunit